MDGSLATVPCPLSAQDQLSTCITPVTSTGEVSFLQVPVSSAVTPCSKANTSKVFQTSALDLQTETIFSVLQGLPEICERLTVSYLAFLSKWEQLLSQKPNAVIEAESIFPCDLLD